MKQPPASLGWRDLKDNRVTEQVDSRQDVSTEIGSCLPGRVNQGRLPGGHSGVRLPLGAASRAFSLAVLGRHFLNGVLSAPLLVNEQTSL